MTDKRVVERYGERLVVHDEMATDWESGGSKEEGNSEGDH
jgi:hypothetical protein